MTLKIIADRNIPQVDRAFAHVGEVELVDGRGLQAEQLGEAQLLLVRSVTRVDRDLLAGSQVRFVGSATIGTDHVDLDYLRAAGIHFSNAPGCNAVSAAEYVVAGVLLYSQRCHIALRGLRVGVVGYGNVGSRVAARLAALGCEIRVYDPPRQHRLQDREYVAWEAIASADIVTAHVPLSHTGDYPTYHMFDDAFFSCLREQALFINTSRGAAVDEAALRQALDAGRQLHLILDVWEHEPDIDQVLLQRAMIATPHIAGYSAEGKFRGLEMVYQAACRYLDVQPQWSMADVLPEYASLYRPEPELDDESLLRHLVRQAYDIELDDRHLRQLADLPRPERCAGFDNLRKQYRVRREFAYYRVLLSPQRQALAGSLSRLGFSVLTQDSPVEA